MTPKQIISFFNIAKGEIIFGDEEEKKFLISEKLIIQEEFDVQYILTDNGNKLLTKFLNLK